MNNIENIISIFNEPVIVWEYKNKYLYCSMFNDEMSKEFNVSNGKKIKNIYDFYSKKFMKYYKNTLKNKSTSEYEVYNNGKRISSTIIFLNTNLILEKLNIIKVKDHEILNDPFNMIIIIKNKSEIYNTNFLFLRNTSYSRNDIIGKHINNIFKESINFNEKQITNNNIILKNNKLLNVDLYSMKLNGIYDIIIIKDITSIKENIINSKIFKNLDTGIIVFDKNNDYFETYKCIDCNNAFLNIFFNIGNIIDKNIIEIFDENIYFKIKKAYTNMHLHDNYILQNIEFNNKYYDFNCFIIEHHIFGIIVIDVSNSLEIKSIKYAKNNFLMGIIDKIKNPIYGISSTLNLLSETELNIEQREYINKTSDCSYFLSVLLNDFTDYANLKLNKLKIEKEAFNLREEIDQYYENVILKTKEKNLNLLFEINSNVPPYIISDKYRFKQIIYNLLGNAIKFTDNGNITLKIYTEPINDNTHNLFIEISDSGMGIEEDKLDKIFDSFYQIDELKEQKKMGSGLGLSICYGLCELLGGKIWVKSEFGIGSTFYVNLPVEEFTDIHQIEEKSLDILKDKKILIIDENSNNRIYISKILLHWKMIPVMSSTFNEALFLINNNRFDTCFIDMDASCTYSYELATKIKDINKYIPIIAMSAFDNKNYKKNVFDYMIMKPISKSKLIKLFINIFFDIDIQIKKKSTDDIQIYNNLPILIYFDDTILATLYRFGYSNITKVGNDHDLLLKVTNDVYSLLLIDIDQMDNLSVLKKVKKINNKIYIIAMIPNSDKKIKKKCDKYNTDAYISKPIDSNELKALLRVICRRINQK